MPVLPAVHGIAMPSVPSSAHLPNHNVQQERNESKTYIQKQKWLGQESYCPSGRLNRNGIKISKSLSVSLLL
jgi:hypothetical protein